MSTEKPSDGKHGFEAAVDERRDTALVSDSLPLATPRFRGRVGIPTSTRRPIA